MKMANCPQCKCLCSDIDERCPNCGYPTKDMFNRIPSVERNIPEPTKKKNFSMKDEKSRIWIICVALLAILLSSLSLIKSVPRLVNAIEEKKAIKEKTIIILENNDWHECSPVDNVTATCKNIMGRHTYREGGAVLADPVIITVAAGVLNTIEYTDLPIVGFYLNDAYLGQNYNNNEDNKTYAIQLSSRTGQKLYGTAVWVEHKNAIACLDRTSIEIIEFLRNNKYVYVKLISTDDENDTIKFDIDCETFNSSSNTIIPPDDILENKKASIIDQIPHPMPSPEYSV